MVFGARFELAIMRLSTARVFQLRHPNFWWAVKEIANGIPGLSANCPKRIVKDLSKGTRLSRLVGYQLPEPSE
jgi:hypothetical protein